MANKSTQIKAAIMEKLGGGCQLIELSVNTTVPFLHPP
jgi:hypothetical protein